MRTKDTLHKSKTSFYIYDHLRAKMSVLIPPRKQGEVINGLIQELVEKIEREKSKKAFLAELHSIKPAKRKETALQTLTKLRKTREKQLFKNLKSK
jgi:hypothetical protein